MGPGDKPGVKTLTRGDRDDPPLRYQVDYPKGEPRVCVLLTHGLGEHRQRYAGVIRAWNDAGIVVASYDLRGHGSSGGARAHVNRFADYVRDAIDLLDVLTSENETWRGLGPPVFFGHSLGGLITIHLALAHPERGRAVALSSPYLGAKNPVPRVKAMGAQVLSRWVPTFSQPTGLNGTDVMRDPVLAEEYDKDPLNVKTVSVRWFTESQTALSLAMERAPSFSLPLFCLASAEDRIVDVTKTDRFIERVGSAEKTYRKLPGFFHELFNDPERAEPINAFADKMLAWSPAPARKAQGQH